MIEQLQEQIKVVVAARDTADGLAERKKKRYTEWEEANTILLEDAKLASVKVSEAEVLLRELTLEAYAEDPTNKHPAKGVDIREVTIYSYNGEEALKWAIEHKMALKLDETKFKSHVKADPPDFVKVTTEPKATIATNLDEICENNTTREEK